ncbi:MAG: SRPBCC family protein [Proteobacteria bacterium]|nr:SRPBCC family protein [Pseudomonadota bacterium]MCP4922124.1 SRPBCC family protein [Pseudomonadota bacterium]
MSFPCTPMGVDDYARMPQRFEFEVEIACTPDELFDVFEDPASWPVWASPGIARVEWTSPKPYGLGTTRTVYMTGGLAVDEEFTVWERGKKMAFTFLSTSEDVWEQFGELYEVQDLGEAGCRLNWTVAYDPRGTFGSIHFLVKPFMGLTLGRYMKSLKKYVEKR